MFVLFQFINFLFKFCNLVNGWYVIFLYSNVILIILPFCLSIILELTQMDNEWILQSYALTHGDTTKISCSKDTEVLCFQKKKTLGVPVVLLIVPNLFSQLFVFNLLIYSYDSVLFVHYCMNVN